MINVVIASQPHRSRLLQKIVDSLNSQTFMPNEITIVFQGYAKAIHSDSVKVNTIYLKGNYGAAVRFKYSKSYCVNIILDDDFIPGHTFVESMYNFINEHPSSVGSLWGYNPTGKDSYAHGLTSIACWDAQGEDANCPMLGCGLMVFDGRVNDLSDVSFEKTNYNDIQVAIHCANKGIDMYSIIRKGDEVVHVGDEDIQEGAIHKDFYKPNDFLDKKLSQLLSIFEKTNKHESINL